MTLRVTRARNFRQCRNFRASADENRGNCAPIDLARSLHTGRVMPNRKSRTPHPGALPEIQATGSSVTFRLEVAGVRHSPTLLLRCDPDGNVWASIEGPPPDAEA
jgi:hypothetical protein